MKKIIEFSRLRKKYDACKQVLNKYNQSHLLRFYNHLDIEKKELLLNQVLRIDFEQISNLYKNSYIEKKRQDIITPLQYFEAKKFSSEELEYYNNIGINSIKNGEFAVITLAGGQGSRLGHSGPKGTFELKLAHAKKSLFEILCDNLKNVNTLYNVDIPWYIMTSEKNNQATIQFFEENQYFIYPHKNIHFFKQEKLPVTDVNGKLMLSELFLINEASNGNGDVYRALKKNNIIKKLKADGIKWIFICGIDNILVKPVDPLFLGLTINKNYKIASKSIFKEDASSIEAVFVNRNGHPSILLPDELSVGMGDLKNTNGDYLYRDTNALCHLFNISALEKCSDIELPYHRAYKKNTFINYEGMKEIPNTPNTFKFEKFIFDAFEHFDDMLLFRVDKDKEFAPIKDLDSMDKSTKLYEKKFIETKNKSN